MNWKRERKWKGERLWSISENRMTRIILHNSLGRPGIPYSVDLSVNSIPSPYKIKLEWGGKKKKKNLTEICETLNVSFPLQISWNFTCLSTWTSGPFHRKKDQRLNSFAMTSGFSINYWELSLKKTNLIFKEVHDYSPVCVSGGMFSANPSSFFWTFFPMKKAAHLHCKSE